MSSSGLVRSMKDTRPLRTVSGEPMAEEDNTSASMALAAGGSCASYPSRGGGSCDGLLGVAGSVADSIQIATSELANWLKRDYRLNDSEVALLLGAVAKYDITELVDPQLNVVAKVPKSALKGLQ